MSKANDTTHMMTDAQEMAQLHPDTFEAPSQEDLNAIEPGSVVKVCVGRERFWNIVKTVEGDRITAEVNNDLICTDNHGLRCGDLIAFEKRHVYSIYEG